VDPHRISQQRTIEVGFGALTGRPFALTGARVPAASALRCSRWICGDEGSVEERYLGNEQRERTLAFFETGIFFGIDLRPYCGLMENVLFDVAASKIFN
jgi:hypothetical protein